MTKKYFNSEKEKYELSPMINQNHGEVVNKKICNDLDIQLKKETKEVNKAISQLTESDWLELKQSLGNLLLNYKRIPFTPFQA